MYVDYESTRRFEIKHQLPLLSHHHYDIGGVDYINTSAFVLDEAPFF